MKNPILYLFLLLILLNLLLAYPLSFSWSFSRPFPRRRAPYDRRHAAKLTHLLIDHFKLLLIKHGNDQNMPTAGISCHFSKYGLSRIVQSCFAAKNPIKDLVIFELMMNGSFLTSYTTVSKIKPFQIFSWLFLPKPN